MDDFPPFNVQQGCVSGRLTRRLAEAEEADAVIFSATFDLDTTMDVAEHHYYDRDCPMMWKFEEVHTLYICGPYAKDAFRRYMQKRALYGILSPRLLRLYEHGQMDYRGVPVTFTPHGEGYMFVEHEPRAYQG